MTENNLHQKEEMWQHFFNKPKRYYNLYIFKMLEYQDYIIFEKEKINEKKGNWNNYFKNENPICLEIGCGSGGFSQEIANRNKNKNFICLELRFKRLCMCAKKAERLNLKNIVFLRQMAENINDFLNTGEISEIYINFPEPWDKKEENRILQKDFFYKVDNILKVGGKIFFKTDHDKYYEDIINLVKNELENFELIYYTNDLHNSDKSSENIKTEFENLFLHKHNKNINYMEIKKIK